MGHESCFLSCGEKIERVEGLELVEIGFANGVHYVLIYRREDRRLRGRNGAGGSSSLSLCSLRSCSREDFAGACRLLPAGRPARRATSMP